MYDYNQLRSNLAWLQHKFPFIKCNVIGKSVLEKNIYELRIGSGEKVIHYNAAFHANEWITSFVLMKWISQLLHFQNIETFNTIQLSLVPMVNPDGVELVSKGLVAAQGLYNVEEMNEYNKDFCRWKANIRGVDLNKQYPANWQQYKEAVYCTTPYYRDYPGEEPLTEPESIAMRKLVENNYFESVFSLHTQGKEFYWGYCGYEPPHSKVLADEFERVSGYKGIQYTNSHAGFRDWFICQYRKPGFTLELGKGINPLPMSQFTEIYEQTTPILNASLYM
ncbi:M14 family metallopeptidase [Bacillus massiliigorillae]|uniref:M14 family metallopeptidase n=1 Tax=Bacillus massiliigorillae TaxID=1243664 RepID=UPI001E5C7A4F|nr:M14 family metallocarboxypeptidase [Bacillus massiliigorillae]